MAVSTMTNGVLCARVTVATPSLTSAPPNLQQHRFLTSHPLQIMSASNPSAREATSTRPACALSFRYATVRRHLQDRHGYDVLGSPVVPFYPFCLGVPLLKPNSRKKGTLIIKGVLGNLASLSVDLHPASSSRILQLLQPVLALY